MTPDQVAEIDRHLAFWRQGDVVLGDEIPFIHLADLGMPTTAGAELLAGEEGTGGPAVVSSEVRGLVIVTQTCDLIRTCADRPYVEVCPLVELPADKVTLVRQGRLPRFAALPALDDAKLAADLDRVMTVEKGALAMLTPQRRPGTATEVDAQILTETLGRKRTRAALPNDLVAAVQRMRQRVLDKHRRETREGEFFRAVREIRVRGVPDWLSDVIEVEFLFLFDRGSGIPADADHWIAQLMKLISIGPRIVAVEGRPVGLEQLSAASYLESYRLDLDHLSQVSIDAAVAPLSAQT